ncbi:MAG: MoaD/ThiS family protein [Candidatus Lokiarchaeota archaeon]|nr:MoaD/ThiS family protein [Candidatus Lokiarchaeota archaeon]
MDQKLEHIYEESKTIGSLKEYIVKEKRTVKDLLHDLNLDDKYFAILVDGKKARLDTEIAQGQSIVVLPRIAGG